ncbi:MAG: transposase [Chloroflexota bacterium]
MAAGLAGVDLVGRWGEGYAKYYHGVNINTAESWFALLQRGFVGVYHHMRTTHLNRYDVEFAFRCDNRKVSDSKRTKRAIKGAEDKRLMYKDVIKTGK